MEIWPLCYIFDIQHSDQFQKLWRMLDFFRFVRLIKPICFGEFLTPYRVNLTGFPA